MCKIRGFFLSGRGRKEFSYCVGCQEQGQPEKHPSLETDIVVVSQRNIDILFERFLMREKQRKKKFWKPFEQQGHPERNPEMPGEQVFAFSLVPGHARLWIRSMFRDRPGGQNAGKYGIAHALTVKGIGEPAGVSRKQDAL